MPDPADRRARPARTAILLIVLTWSAAGVLMALPWVWPAYARLLTRTYPYWYPAGALLLAWLTWRTLSRRSRRLTQAQHLVLAAIIEMPGAWGLPICFETGLMPGSVYPALDRLMKDGLITGRWEDPTPADRPPIRYYDPVYAPWWYRANGILDDGGTSEHA